MQCQSYLPLYYDLNMDANGSTRPVYTGYTKPSTGDFNQRPVNFSVSEGFHSGYGKEFLRQTILQQEVTFKGQVQELHRLYRRQRELVDEIKRTNYRKQNVLSEVEWTPNLLNSNVSVSSHQKAAPSIPFNSLGFSHPSSCSANIVQIPWASTKGESIVSSSHVSVNVRSSDVVDLSLSRSNIARKKQLNLNLSADEYITTERRESLKNFEVFGPQNPFLVSSRPATVSSQIFDLGKFSGSEHNRCGGSLNDCQGRKKLKMCADYIETDKTNASQRWQPCGEDEKSRSSLYSSTWYSYSESLQRLAEAGQAHRTASLSTKKVAWLENGRGNTDAEMLDLNTPGQGDASHRQILEFPATHSSKVNPQVPVNEFEHSLKCGEGRSLQINSSESNVKASSATSGFVYQSYKCDLGSAKNETEKHRTRVDLIDLNCTACEETDNVDQGQHGENKKPVLFDINLPFHLSNDMVILEDDPVGHDSDRTHLNLINLSSNVKDDETSRRSASSRKVTDVDLEASMIPISPEKLECPRPRGESEENITEMSLVQLSTREDELVKAAVDVLVSISSSETQQKSTGAENCQASSNEPLMWFAGVVSSMEQGEGFIESTNAIDYFEAMTLKLTEVSEEDYWSKTTTFKNEKEMCDAAFCVESGRGRATKRVKRKNFQREVLPSLASLSKYEASEDIQIIERLLESVGTPRKLGRNRRLKGKKNTYKNVGSTTTSTFLESRTCLLALPHMGSPVIDLKDKDSSMWENMSRQPRGKRSRTIFPNASLSQEGWMKKWGVKQEA